MAGVLIHIGFAKAGSTFLQNWFYHRKDLHYQANSLAGFWGMSSFKRWAIQDQSSIRYHIISDEALSVWQGQSLNVNTFQHYEVAAYQQNVADLLHDLYPHAKVLILTRGIRSLLKSSYFQYVKMGGIIDFDEFLEKYARPYMLEMYNYDRVIRHYQTLFGVEQVIVLPFEWLQKDSESFLQQVEKIVGLDHFPVSDHLLDKNEAFPLGKMTAYRQHYRKVYRWLRLLPSGWGDKLFVYYVYALMFKGYARYIDRLVGQSPSEESFEIPSDILKPFQKNATFAYTAPLYADYLSFYQEI